MSSGDLDDTLASIEEFNEVLKDHNVAVYWQRSGELPIDRSHDVPFGAGISRTGERRYLDRHIHTRWRGVDVGAALAAHESFEWAVRQFLKIGENYQTDPRGHRLANRAELETLKQIMGQSGDESKLWTDYDNFIDPQVKRDEYEKVQNPPPDLALYPYEGTKMEKTLVDHGARAEAVGARVGADAGRRPERQRGRADKSAPINRPGNQPAGPRSARKSLRPKKEVQYEPKATHPDHCAICTYFRPPNACAKVVPPISPQGWCKLFERKQDVQNSNNFPRKGPGLPANKV